MSKHFDFWKFKNIPKPADFFKELLISSIWLSNSKLKPPNLARFLLQTYIICILRISTRTFIIITKASSSWYNFCRKVITIVPGTLERGADFHWPWMEHGFFVIEVFYLFSVNDIPEATEREWKLHFITVAFAEKWTAEVPIHNETWASRGFLKSFPAGA